MPKDRIFGLSAEALLSHVSIAESFGEAKIRVECFETLTYDDITVYYDYHDGVRGKPVMIIGNGKVILL